MDAFVTGITSIISGIFTALVNSLSSIGNVVFTMGENGAITGPSGFGWLLILGIGLPLATWLFGKLFSFVKSIGRGNR